MSAGGERLAGAQASQWAEPWIVARAARTPEAPALVLGAERFDYRALALRVERVARVLAGCGVERGAIVAVQLPNGMPMLELVHASFVLDFTLQLVNTRLTPNEVEYQLRDSGAGFFVHLVDDADAASVGLDGNVVRLHVNDAASGSSISCPEVAAPSGGQSEAVTVAKIAFTTPRFILYTSGTSGQPKGVALDAENLFASATGQAALLGADASDRWLLCLPIFHVGGLSILLRSVLAGSCVVLHEQFDPARVARDLAAETISGISLVANMLARVLDEMKGEHAASSLGCVLLGGGATPQPLLDAAREAGFPIAPTYGLTEAASQVATRPPGEGEGRGLTLLPGTRVKVVDEDGFDLARGATGEICIHGPTVATAYWQKPDASAEAFRDGWLHTGDVGALDPDGRLRVFDRRSDLIISGGENIYPAEIEAVLLAHPDVSEAGVTGIADATYGARPAAWIVPREGASPRADELRAFCRDRLAVYKCPVAFRRVDALPRNATGKLLRRELGR
ncbi:MAG: o-succinylbenzoate--CoA ligase [Myxococcota bacterium]|nr:o-succinylbenzoate--CoA ligase [Myxococcota bacterium]